MTKNIILSALLTTTLSLAASAQTMPDAMATVTYKPTDKIITNPERGMFTHQEFYSDKTNELDMDQLDQWRDQGLSLVFTAYIMRDFRDKDISQKYLNRIKRNFRALRACGMKAVVRFCYSYSEADKPWDAPWELTRRHIEQLTPILRDNADVIAVLEAGFVGVWGEWYYTDHYNYQPTKEQYGPRRQVLEALLEAMPKDRFVAVRYPAAKLGVWQIDYQDTISWAKAHDGSPISRTAFHNDCFLATSDDMGTFNDVPQYRRYWEWESRYVPMGGETCAPSAFCEVPNAVKAFEAYHWSYLNRDYHPDVLARWENENFLDVVKKRLGYRLVLQQCSHTTAAQAGGEFQLDLELRNEGWAAPYNPRGVELIFKKGKEAYKLTLKDDPRRWMANQATHINTRFRLPEEMSAGTYKVYLSLPDPAPSLYGKPAYSIQLANEDVWERKTGYNQLFEVEVKGGGNKTAAPSLPVLQKF